MGEPSTACMDFEVGIDCWQSFALILTDGFFDLRVRICELNENFYWASTPRFNC
jgi:hypothetical protein